MLSNSSLTPYLNLLPEVLIAFFVALMLTPLIGKIASKIGAVDLPAKLRRRTDPTLAQRIHKRAKPRMGGLAVLIPLVLISAGRIDFNTQLTGIIIALIILIVVGTIDDKFELSGRSQFVAHFIAALIVVMFGTSIYSIQVAGINLDFNNWQTQLDIGSLVYNLTLPADLITIFWIMAIINAINWVCGIDALGESVTFIASVTITLLSVKLGNPELAVITAVLAGGVLGFIPYNFPPSKIIGGTAAHTAYGFLLAVFSMINGAKIPTAIIILGIPIADMIWVIFYRIRKHKDVPFFKRPFVSGSVHLHHRLMQLGFNVKQTLFIEITIMTLLCFVAFYLAGFSATLIAPLAVIAILFLLFAVITVGIQLSARKKARQEKDKPPPPVIRDETTPEQKFAY